MGLMGLSQQTHDNTGELAMMKSIRSVWLMTVAMLSPRSGRSSGGAPALGFASTDVVPPGTSLYPWWPERSRLGPAPKAGTNQGWRCRIRRQRVGPFNLLVSAVLFAGCVGTMEEM